MATQASRINGSNIMIMRATAPKHGIISKFTMYQIGISNRPQLGVYLYGVITVNSQYTGSTGGGETGTGSGQIFPTGRE